MSTTLTPPPTPLEDELREFEDAVDQRTGNMEMREGFGLLFTFFALAIAIGALVVALVGGGGKTTTKTVIQRVPAPAAAAPAAPAAAAPAAQSASGPVSVKLGDMFVRPNAVQATAGKVTFNVQNTGKLVHEMIVGRPPITGPLASGKMSEATSVGEVSELDPGKSGHVTLTLKPGNYVLYCNISGHYVAGQHVAFTVK